MKHTKKNIMGMLLDEWKHKSCEAHFGVGEENGKKWATLYDIVSTEPGKGHAFELLTEAKKYYKKKGKEVGGSISLNPIMRKLYKDVGIKEYEN